MTTQSGARVASIIGDDAIAASVDWANSAEYLPDMPACDAAYAANMIATRMRRIPYPLDFQHPAPSKIEEYMYPVQKQVQTLQAAYASCATVAIVDSMLELNHLMEAEVMELHAACKEEEGLQGTRTPRVASITLLLYTTNSSDQMRLLDAMATLASAPNESNQHAAETARFAFLVSRSAIYYAASVSKKAIHSTSKARAPGQGLNGSGVGAELCVRWGDIVPSPEEYADADCVDIRTEFEDIPHCNSAAEYVLALRTALRKVWNDSNFHFEGRVMETYSPHKVDGSYERAFTEAAYNFHAKLCPPTDVQLSNDTKDVDFSGSLMHSGMYVRLVPRDCKDAYNRDDLAHQRAYYGFLLHQRPLTTDQLNQQQVLTGTDWSRMARTFCASIKDEERKHPIFGLREPQTQDERAIAMHILSARMEWVDFGSSVSVYGQGGVPGRIFDKRFGAKVVQLVRTLVPLDLRLKDSHFLLPCSRPVRSNQEHSQYSLLMARLCDAMNEMGDVVEPVPSNTNNLQPISASWPQLDVHVTTEEERRTRQLLGVALNSPALRIGDAEQAVSAEHGPTAVVSMLSAMAHVLSPDSSVEDGMQFATSLLRKQPSTSGNKHLREEEATNVAAKMPCRCSEDDGLSKDGLRTVMAGLGVEWSKPAMTFKKQGPVCNRALAALRKVVDTALGTKQCPSDAKQGALDPQDVHETGTEGDIKRIALTIALSLQHSEAMTHGVIMMMLPDSASAMEFAIVDGSGELKPLSPVALMNMDSSKTGFVGYSASARRVDACLRKPAP